MFSTVMEFEGLFDAVPDALLGVDEAGVIQFVNHRAESLFGYEPGDLVGVRLETLVPESGQQVHAAHQEGYHPAPGNRPIGTDLKLIGRRRDGTEFPADIALSCMDTVEGLVLIAAVHDMTNFRTAEAALRRLDRLAAIVEHSDDAIISSTLDGVITSWNPAAERLYGYSSEEIIGESILPVMPEDRTDEINTILAKVRAGRPVEHFETLGVRKDGTVFPASLTVSPIRDADGTITGASVIFRDVTERMKAAEVAQRMIAIVENSNDAITSETLDGIITSWNPAAERLYGYSSEEIIGRSVDLLSPEDRTGEIEALLTEVKAGEHVDHFETFRVRKDGTAFPASLTVSPIRDADGAVIGASAIARDVTEQKGASELARSIIEASLDPLVTISPEGRITHVNEATVKATGVARDKLIGTSFSDYFTDPEKAGEVSQQVFEQGSVTDYPLTLLSRNAHEYPIEVLYNASVYCDASGEVIGVVAAARDVTKQVQAQRAIAEQQARELERLAELERFQRLTVGRELKMIELKKQIEYLKKYGSTQGAELGD